MQHAKWKEPDVKDRIWHNSIDKRCPEEANWETESGWPITGSRGADCLEMGTGDLCGEMELF